MSRLYWFDLIFCNSRVKFRPEIHCIPCIFYNRAWPLWLTFSYFHQLNLQLLCSKLDMTWPQWVLNITKVCMKWPIRKTQVGKNWPISYEITYIGNDLSTKWMSEASVQPWPVIFEKIRPSSREDSAPRLERFSPPYVIVFLSVCFFYVFISFKYGYIYLLQTNLQNLLSIIKLYYHHLKLCTFYYTFMKTWPNFWE